MIPDLIYDIGMHRGEDTEFYLQKGFRVVAIEADPRLVDKCRNKFQEAVRCGRLQIIEGAISPPAKGEKVTFYRNPRSSIWGTVEKDWADRNAALGFGSEAIEVQRIEILRIFDSLGIPHYVKIDIEGADRLVLDALRQTSERPHYLSIESEKVDFADLLREFDILERLGYVKFKVVQQQDIPGRSMQLNSIGGRPFEHTFRDGASGPFGDDIPQPWLSRSEAIERYRRIFTRYKLFGDRSRYTRLPRAARGIISVAYKSATGYRGPLPGWFDTHASL